MSIETWGCVYPFYPFSLSLELCSEGAVSLNGWYRLVSPSRIEIDIDTVKRPDGRKVIDLPSNARRFVVHAKVPGQARAEIEAYLKHFIASSTAVRGVPPPAYAAR